MVRIQIAGDKWDGFTWHLVEDGVEVKSGREDTQAKAVVTGQAALMAHTYRHWVDNATSCMPQI